MRDYPKMIDQGATVEEIIRALRDDGFSKAPSIKALCDFRLANLAEAKRLIHFSETWADRKAEDEAFHEELVEAMSTQEAAQKPDK
jgi:hypothetical protein